jgi:hypothetical protein
VEYVEMVIAIILKVVNPAQMIAGHAHHQIRVAMVIVMLLQNLAHHVQ